MADATVWSGSAGSTLDSSVSINDTRRKFNFGDRVAELAPMQSPFFVYLSKVAKRATNDPVFKFLEQRHQWQRRNFEVASVVFNPGAEVAGTALANAEDLHITAKYDKYGKISSADNHCEFIVPGSVIALVADSGTVFKFKVDHASTVKEQEHCQMVSTSTMILIQLELPK